MFTRKRQRKPPKGGYKSPMQRLVKRAQEDLKARGSVSVPLKPWLDAASLYLTLQAACRTVLPYQTPEWFLGETLRDQGWAWRIQGENLELDLPGWTPPPPHIVVVQPSLFD